ncbi:MAG: ribonuclease Y [Chloroflexi bacterium RBG_13_56_8]|nr:MAG: ribonuclease Y [Chloroflexi bacterium RBG_13_56_8]
MGFLGQFGWILIVAVACVVGFVVGYVLRNRLGGKNIAKLETEAERRLMEADTQAREAELEAKRRGLEIIAEAEAEGQQRSRELNRIESRIQERQESLDRRLDALENRQRAVEDRKRELDKRQAELDKAWEKHLEELERISGLSQDEAKELLFQSVEKETRTDCARIIREIEANAHEEADRKSREIITRAIQRVASDQVTEITVSMVELPSDDMKGRIIGRGGRNIRAIENATGVDLVIDDTPEAVLISSFDPVRREVARIALSRLILDGRIHPARIEGVVEKARAEVDEAILEAGKQAVFDMGVHGLHPEIVKILGRLRYRTSYGQNVLQHSIETAQLAAMMAAELGANVELAKKAGLLHDIGKAVDHEVEGSHAVIGAEIAERYGLPEDVINAIGAHHGDTEQQTLEAILVEAADAISSARPGARRESLESYIKRIKALEQLAASFEGVETAYAIQAGREIRIMVKPEEIDDLAAIHLSRDIAKKVEESLQYPGQIKVTVIRETRATEYAT